MPGCGLDRSDTPRAWMRPEPRSACSTRRAKQDPSVLHHGPRQDRPQGHPWGFYAAEYGRGLEANPGVQTLASYIGWYLSRPAQGGRRGSSMPLL